MDNIINNNWNYDNYTPLHETKTKVFISQISPSEFEIEVSIVNAEGGFLYYKEFEKNSFSAIIINNGKAIIKAKNNTVYEIFAESKTNEKSLIRLAETGNYYGKVINYLHKDDKAFSFSGQYLCSPCIIKLQNGKILISMDVYRHMGPQNLTFLFESNDDGKTFDYVTSIFPCFWGQMFEHNSKLYMLSTSCEYGDLLIGESLDDGKTWSSPKVLLRGSGNVYSPGIGKAPVPVIEYEDYLYTAVEWGCWEKMKYASTILKAKKNSDLLNPLNWVFCGFMPFDSKWNNYIDMVGGIEGNVVISNENEILNFLRFDKNEALVMQYKNNEIIFKDIRQFPFGHTKFEIRKYKNLYYAVGNEFPGRNCLAIYTSKDLHVWDKLTDVVNLRHLDEAKVGFQYPSFFIHNGIMNIASRTAINNANNFHDSNCITFHQVKLNE